jgi:hypothetical protein
VASLVADVSARLCRTAVNGNAVTANVDVVLPKVDGAARQVSLATKRVFVATKTVSLVAMRVRGSTQTLDALTISTIVCTGISSLPMEGQEAATVKVSAVTPTGDRDAMSSYRETMTAVAEPASAYGDTLTPYMTAATEVVAEEKVVRRAPKPDDQAERLHGVAPTAAADHPTVAVHDAKRSDSAEKLVEEVEKSVDSR